MYVLRLCECPGCVKPLSFGRNGDSVVKESIVGVGLDCRFTVARPLFPLGLLIVFLLLFD